MNLFDFSKLNNSKYPDWEWHWTMLLDYEDLTGYIDDTTPRPTTDEAVIENWTKNDKMARIAICMKLELDQRIHVQNEKTAKEAWEALREQYFTVNSKKRCAANKKHNSLTSKLGTPMRVHIAQFKNLQEDLVKMGYNFTEKDVAEDLIMYLPEEKDRHKKQSFDSSGIDRLTFETMKKKYSKRCQEN